MLDCQLERKNYLQINAFLDLVIIEQEEKPYALQKKTIKKAVINSEKKN